MGKTLTTQDTAYKLQKGIVRNKENLSLYTKEELKDFVSILTKQRDKLSQEYQKFDHPADWYDHYVHPYDWAISKVDFALNTLETSEEESSE